MAQLKIEIPRKPDPAEMASVISGLAQSNRGRLPQTPSFSSLSADVEESFVFLRDERNQVCGGAYLQFSFDVLYVNSFWVSEKFQKQGHGARLYKAVEDLAYIKKMKRAVLSVFEFQTAVQFWEKLGYLRIGSVPAASPGTELIYLSKFIKSEVR